MNDQKNADDHQTRGSSVTIISSITLRAYTVPVVVEVQFTVPFVGGKAKWIEQQRRNEQEWRRQFQHQSQSPAVSHVLKASGF